MATDRDDPDEGRPPLTGVRVLEVATHVFAPMAAAVLREWGADVVKVERPGTGDPYRGLVTAGLHKLHDGVDPFFQSANRGKRSVGIDLKHPDGRALLSRLVAWADVFLTNLRPQARERLHIDVDDVRADNPSIIYARASAFGARGPDAGRGGYDSSAYFARSGMQHLMTAPGAPFPTPARPAFGDVVGGVAVAGAISAALYRRATGGPPAVVDASLLASGLWQVQADVVNAKLGDTTHERAPDRYRTRNPLTLAYRTADDRFVQLTMISPDRHWPALCRALGRPALATDPRFVDVDQRREHAAACVELLEEVFAGRPLADWRDALAGFEGEWAVVQTPLEVHDDPQVVEQGYVATVDAGTGSGLPMVTNPVQFDECANQPSRAPELGEHTESVLLELGCSWEDLTALKHRGAIL